MTWTITCLPTYLCLSDYLLIYTSTYLSIYLCTYLCLSTYLLCRSPEWDGISDLAKDFIRSLLQKDPARRLTPEASQLSSLLASYIHMHTYAYIHMHTCLTSHCYVHCLLSIYVCMYVCN